MHLKWNHEDIYWLGLLHLSYNPKIITWSAQITLHLVLCWRQNWAQQPVVPLNKCVDPLMSGPYGLSSCLDLDHVQDNMQLAKKHYRNNNNTQMHWILYTQVQECHDAQEQMGPNAGHDRKKELKNIFIKQLRNRTQKCRQAWLNRAEKAKQMIQQDWTENQDLNTNWTNETTRNRWQDTRVEWKLIGWENTGSRAGLMRLMYEQSQSSHEHNWNKCKTSKIACLKSM